MRHTRLALLLLVHLSTACGGSERAPSPADAGPPKRRTTLPADGGLFIDPDREVRELGTDILRDVGRLDARAGLSADRVTIGEAYRYGFAFADGEVPEGHEALAVPVTVRAAPGDLSHARFTLVDERGRRVAAEPIVEWLDGAHETIVPPPAPPPPGEQHLLLVYFVPRALRAGALRYGDATLGPVRRGARGPVRPRSSCKLLGAFGYTPIPRQVLLEVEVTNAFASWTPVTTAVTAAEGDAPPTRCRGFRRLDTRGALEEIGTAAMQGALFVPRGRFLAVYDLPEDEAPGTLRWDGTDCEATLIPARAPLPERLGPERGPPRLETADESDERHPTPASDRLP
jgi:hypothetical protein